MLYWRIKFEWGECIADLKLGCKECSDTIKHKTFDVTRRNALADLCLTTESEWETLAELNPQLKMQLKAVAMSEPLLTNVMCFHRKYQNGRRKTVVDEMLKMHETLKGRQLLTITRTDRMVAFKPDSLDSLIKLRERHRNLAATAEGTGAPSGAGPVRLSTSANADGEQ